MTPKEALHALEIGDFADHYDRNRALALFDCLVQWAEESGWSPDPALLAERLANRLGEQDGDP